MRQGKISALIHNSAAHPNLDSCSVEVHFEEITDLVRYYLHVRLTNSPVEESKPFPIPRLSSQEKHSRTNASQYSINGKNSNYTEVTTMLREKGIDLDHKRFLILQVLHSYDKTSDFLGRSRINCTNETKSAERT